MSKAIPTRTMGPIHFEDLEPHRFEDLVRQLVYDLKDWRYLEATGRAGSDQGFDIRGSEIVSGGERSDRGDDDESEERVDTAATAADDRLWLIQCKREKAINPKKLVGYLEEIPPDARSRLYGLIFAAAADFSKKARDAFREKAREFGLSEVHLWGKAELEDVLYQPKNDHLLFAYTGVSLQVRRRSLKTEVRARLAMKRKAKRCLRPRAFALFRDATDERYPWLDLSKPVGERGRWRIMRVGDLVHDGLGVVYSRQAAFLDDDGVHWDAAELMNDNRPSRLEDPWHTQGVQYRVEDRDAALDVWRNLPENNRGWLERVKVLPFENILDIDEGGDNSTAFPHVYTGRWDDQNGPFREYEYARIETIEMFNQRAISPKVKDRVKVFARKGDAPASQREGESLPVPDE
ncbi:MAG: hypothetical protein ACKVRO_01620 [Micropepsaceae bacterium]